MQLNLRSVAWVRQFVVFAGLAALFAFVFSNVAANLKARGLDLTFEFLSRPASFDLPFRLIEFSSRDSYGRAALVALLNTALVSGLAIVTATIIGFVLGTLLLSPNPLLRRTTFAMVEVIKNTPQILQLLFWYVFILHQLPSARESYQPVKGVFLNVRGLFVPSAQLAVDEGRGWMAWLAIAGAVLVIAIAMSIIATPERQVRLRRASVALALLVAVPVFWLLSRASFSLSYPELRGFNFNGGVQVVPELIALWLGLAIYASSFIADLVRGAVLAVPKGQEEAAYSLGLNHGQTLWLIKLPQALQIVVPPLVSQYLNITKSSTLGIAIAYPEIMTVVGGTTLNQTGHAIETMLIIMSLFVTLNLAVSALMNRYNRRVALRGLA